MGNIAEVGYKHVAEERLIVTKGTSTLLRTIN